MRRLIRFLLLLALLGAAAGAVAVAFVDLPAQREAVSEPVEIDGLKQEVERVK